MPDQTPKTENAASKPKRPEPRRRQTELEEPDLDKVTGGAPNLSEITISKSYDKSSP